LLKTDDGFEIAQPGTGFGDGLTISQGGNHWDIVKGASNQILFAYNSAQQITFMITGNEIRFGTNTADTNLYRSAANLLKTDDSFHATLGLITNAQLKMDGGTTSADGLLWGSDVNLYRSAANVLKTDDSLEIATDIIQDDVIYPGGIVITLNVTNKKYTITVKAYKFDDTVGVHKRTIVRIWFSQFSTFFHTFPPVRYGTGTFNILEGFLIEPDAREGGGSVTVIDTGAPYEFITNESGELKFELETTDTSTAVTAHMRVSIQGIIYTPGGVTFNKTA